jgi:FtsH-binding integral membrane protein
MASTGISSQIELYYFLIIIALILILRVRRTLNGQRYSNRIFTLPIIYALILLSFIVTLTIEEIIIAVVLAVVAIPLGIRLSVNPEFFFRNNVLFFKRSVVLTIIWLAGFIARVFLEIFYSTGDNAINFIITGLLAFTLGLIIGERYMIYAKGAVIQRTGKIIPSEEFLQ